MRKALTLCLLTASLLAAPAEAAESDFYAYYTRLDYRIPLSEVRMNVPFTERVEAPSEEFSGVPQTKDPVLKIGATAPDFGGMFQGRIDNLCIYNRVLNHEEIKRLYDGEIVRQGLRGNYKFNRSPSDSAGGKPALLQGCAGFSPESREGSHSLSLDGENTWVQSPVKVDFASGFTWSAWIKTRNDGTIVSYCNESGIWHANGRSFFIRNGGLVFDIGWVGAIEKPVNVADGRWHHVAVTGMSRLEQTGIYMDGKSLRSPKEGTAITGKYADVVVHVDSGRQLVFSRETSYLPYLETPHGRFSMKKLVDCKPDPMCLCSYVRIIESSREEAIVHWRHVPDPHSIKMTREIHEIFEVSADGEVLRRVKAGTESLEDFQDPANVTVQKLHLRKDGIEELSLSKPRLTRMPGPPVEGRAVKEKAVGSPSLWFRFDEGLKRRPENKKNRTKENIGGTVCNVTGNKTLWKRGVSGTALAFDGYFSEVALPAEKAPKLAGELTLEAWVALGAYPWHDCGIVHQSVGEPIAPEEYKQGYQEPYGYGPWMVEGYMLGVDPYGRPVFKANGYQAGGGALEPGQTVKSSSVLPTYRWVHLAATYGNGAMRLYANGKLVASRAATGRIEVPDVPLRIGRNGSPQRVANPVRPANCNLPVRYGIEGLIDEVKLYNTVLSAGQIRKSFRSFRPPNGVLENPDLEPRTLPGKVTGMPADRFAAHYETLHFHDLWDNLWRPSSYRDVVVRFDTVPCNVVFWRGTNSGSNWVTGNNRWMADQSCEIGGPHGCAEHMADKRGRFCHVRIIENTGARKVIHWRYASSDVGYKFPAPDVWADEYYTIYPDGAGVRHVARGKGGWHDTQFLLEPGTTGLENVNRTALTVANLEGRTAELTWELPNHVPRNPLEDACIKVIHFNSKYDVFAICREGARLSTWGANEQSPHTADPFAGPWNHWPVGLMPSDGRYAGGSDRVAHAALGAAGQYGNVMMYGFTGGPASDLVPLARSWNSPPELKAAQGCRAEGYDMPQRAYKLTRKAANMSFTIDASVSSPVCNLCFVIRNWQSNREAKVSVNGEKAGAGSHFRQGIVRGTDGKRRLVVWLGIESTRPVNLKLGE